MKQKWPAFAGSSEVVGVLFGLLLAACVGRVDHEINSLRVLGSMVLLGSIGGFVTASFSSRKWVAPYDCVRSGARAGVVASLVAGAALVLRAWSLPGSGAAWHGLILAAASLFPSMLAGTVAAGLGYFCFRRRVAGTAQTSDKAPWELPRWFPIAARSFVGLLCVSALTAPFFPRPYSASVWNSAPPPITAEPARGMGEEQGPLLYPIPEALKSAPAAAWSVSMTRQLGRLDPVQGFAMSKDERWIVGVDGASDDSLVMISLDSDNVSRTPPLPFSVDRAAFNEATDRLFLVSSESTPRLAVLELATRRVILLPQPKNAAVPNGRVYWWRDHQVIFDPASRPKLALDLDTLELDKAEWLPEEQIRFSRGDSSGFLETERWKFSPGSIPVSAELPETEGSEKWNLLGQAHLSLVDSQNVYARFFPEIDVAPDDVWHSVANGSKMLRFRGGSLDVFHFDTRPVPTLRWKLTMPCPPDDMPGLVAKALKTGDLAMLLYSPLVNPLNNKTIGPDRTKPKAILTVAAWQDTDAEVSISGDAFPYQPGDVLADLFVMGSTPELIRFPQPHRWWTVCSEPPGDAADPGQLPRRDEVTKRREDELAKRQKEEEALKKKIAAESLSPARAFDEATRSAPEQVVPVTQALANTVAQFVASHHKKASEGRVRDVVQDYAEMVDHFSNGMVLRDFILEDETKYHRNYNFVHEEVVGDVRVSNAGEGLLQAQYVMRNQWQKAADGKQGGGLFDVTLTLAPQSGGSFLITKHRSTAKK